MLATWCAPMSAQRSRQRGHVAPHPHRARCRAAPARRRRGPRLEYGCHVRDVYRIGDERLRRMLEEDDPTFANWDQDVTAVEDRYTEQDPAVVADELAAAAARVRAALRHRDGCAMERRGLRSDGARFTVDSFARYLVHDPFHHVWDVESHTERPCRRRVLSRPAIPVMPKTSALAGSDGAVAAEEKFCTLP